MRIDVVIDVKTVLGEGPAWDVHGIIGSMAVWKDDTGAIWRVTDNQA